MRFMGLKGNRYKFLWSGADGASGVGILLQEDLCDEVVEVRRVSERIMVMHKKQLIRIIIRRGLVVMSCDFHSRGRGF